MHFIHRVLEESSVHINIVYYEGFAEPLLVYFRKTRADIMRADEIYAPKFLASVKLPSEIKSVTLVGNVFCMWTAYGFLVCCKLLHSLEFKEVAKTGLHHIHPARNVLYSSGEAVILVESQGARYFSVQRGCGELAICTKNRVVDATFAGNMMHSIETDGNKSFLTVYEVCVDMALHRSTVEIEHTSYLIAVDRKSSYVFSDGVLQTVQDGKIHSSVKLPQERIKGCSFSKELSSLFVFTEDGCVSVVSSGNRLESLGNVGPVAGIFLLGRCLLTFGLQSRIYAIQLSKRNLELIGDVSADQKIVLRRQFTEEDADFAKRKLCVHKYRQTLNVCRSHDSFLEIRLKHVCVENRGAMPVLCKNRCPARSIFVGENAVALLREGSVLVYSISGDVLKAEKHVKAADNVSEILLFRDRSFLALHGSEWSGVFSMEGDLYVTYTENAVTWYSPGPGALNLAKRREFKFRVCGLDVFRKLLVLHSGAVLWVFDCDLDAFVFVQILDSDIRGCFVQNTFLYVLTKEATVSIYKMHDCGRMELPVRVCLEERHATVKGSIVYAESRMYLFIGYDFISLDIPKDTIDMKFCKNALYIHTYSSFSAFHVVLDECIDNAHRMSESKVLLKYSASSGYVVATSAGHVHVRGHKEQNREHSSACSYRLAIINRDFGSTVHVYRDSDLVNYRDFKEKVSFAIFCGKNVVCALPFRCLVLVIGKKQLVAKSQVKLPSEICSMQEVGNDLYVKTRTHSVFKYALSQNTLVLVCSDVLNRRISTFKVLTDRLIVFGDMSGFVGVLEQKGHTYETKMSWYAGEAVVHLRAECHGIIYETADRQVGELICIDSRLFSMLEAAYFHLFLKYHEKDIAKYEYPVVNALPACFEMSGLIADNLNALGSSPAADHFRLCALLKLTYGSWTMKRISH